MERDRYKELEKESSLVSILDTLEKQSYEEAVQWLEQKGN